MRAWFLDAARWYDDWPRRAVSELEARGFVRVRLEQIEPHPVWHVRARLPDGNLTLQKAGRVMRRIIEREGTIPHGGFFSFSPRKGVIEAAFVLIV